MEKTNDNPMNTMCAALWALANEDPDFTPFYEKYQDEMEPHGLLTDELVSDVMAIAQTDPHLAEKAKLCHKNAQDALDCTVPGLTGVGVLIAALFVLRTHIKIQRTTEGKWEILVEHESIDTEPLVKILEKIMDLLN